ncbi:MAG: hypothetical protein COB20_14310 [SAR86 cluster bacterium]|uniref:DUF5666 domain-containing protein n=1 Tax=SAR86 cluster bacterium TaxID=2030880 RepID=A0A2A4WYD1_9GAMM|nr:MAG: hypothetical protein COB20_14310 [SAR86 cluster bacterium]
MKYAMCFLLSVTTLGLLSLTTQAHHSTSNFDSSQEITLRGTVTRVEWVNPHVYIYIDEQSSNGESVRWEIEGQPPAALRRLGWSRDMLSVGDSISVTGNPAKDSDVKKMNGQLIEKEEGTLYDETQALVKMAAAPTPRTGASSLAGIWTTKLDLSNYYHFFFGAGEEELTDKGRVARAQYDENTMNPGLNCLSLDSPSLMLMADTKKITIAEDKIQISADYDNGERTVHMNATSHEGASVSSQGHSIGYWEGDDLIIDTTHFSESITGNGKGVPSGSEKHLVERLILNEDRQSLTYSFELADAEYIATPITGSTTWFYQSDSNFVTEDCSLENARRYLELEQQ